MIYPSYGVNIESIKQLLLIHDTLRYLYIKNLPIDLVPRLWIDGNNQCASVDKVPDKIPIVSLEEFVQIYRTFYEDLSIFLASLQVGDKVIIEQRRGVSTNYQFSFSSSMAERYSGKEMTISKIQVGCPEKERKFCNGDGRKFFMIEDHGDYMWHSSMFEFYRNSITKIALSDISVDPFLL